MATIGFPNNVPNLIQLIPTRRYTRKEYKDMHKVTQGKNQLFFREEPGKHRELDQKGAAHGSYARRDPKKGKRLTQQKITKFNPFDSKGEKQSIEMEKRYGLPHMITGNPLGCGCNEAYLSGVGEVTESGEIECDYRCDANWANFVVFRLKQKPKKKVVKKKKEVTLGGEGYQAKKLEEL